MRINNTSDVIGVEICGALKNVLAIAAGIVEGLHLGNNAMAALVTQVGFTTHKSFQMSRMIWLAINSARPTQAIFKIGLERQHSETNSLVRAFASLQLVTISPFPSS